VRRSDLLYTAYGGAQKQLVNFEGDHNSQHHVLTFRARDLLTAIFKMHRCVVWGGGGMEWLGLAVRSACG
jgi:hypothetical protein